ncbi:MAG: class IV adenylate cyclase [Planctomycetes bacterium]|nr:class IV adenylate cyclase [Planctomycetota bacterium]
MPYEVELKFPLDDVARIRRQLDDLGAEAGDEVEQVDRYYAHPSRDFAQTDEALRIRRTGDVNRVTYKGPIVDKRSKTRREIELRIGENPEDGEQFAELLEALGFRPVREVRKRRVAHDFMWEKRKLELALDEVDGLGSFLEIETIAKEPDREPARDAILRLAKKLGLENSELRSYLTLLLEQDVRRCR